MKRIKSRNKLNFIRQEILKLSETRKKHIKKLLNPMPMVVGSFYEVYKTCSKPNCCCQKGKKHGPFPALSISIDAKRKLKMVRQDDLEVVKEKALAYQSFQQELAIVRKLNKEIDILLEKIKKELIEEYK